MSLKKDQVAGTANGYKVFGSKTIGTFGKRFAKAALTAQLESEVEND